MTILAEILADSVGPHSKRLTTYRLRYPRFIHAEMMTHRVFSRNASSSRAVPVQKLINDVYRDPAMPISWGKNQKGMQAQEDVSPEEATAAKKGWLQGRDLAIDQVMKLMELGIHKQLANRLLEPWAHINVIVTATEWANFFALRCHPDAQPEIRDLAEKMKKLLDENEPKLLQPGEWHLPLVDAEDWLYGNLEIMKKVSVARCARTSYFTFDGKRSTVEANVKLYDKLLASQPLHASPAEHQATPDMWFSGAEGPYGEWKPARWRSPNLSGNFAPGWIQFRKLLPNEYIPG